MLKLIDTGIENTIGFSIDGKITKEDMSLVLSAVKEKGEQHSHLFLYEEIESIGGLEFRAMLEKLSFLWETGFSNIRKIAIVSDKRWVHTVVDIEDRIFRGIQMKSFDQHEKPAALAFLHQHS
ncbi:MAG: STAS/SEC14 domain-containing protein [Oceanospirillaceae bacterium]|nr:STAS/SEC14 domain-containing protein [Oceanospirillaceae bacterium]